MKKIKALLKSKAGMTFVELITALALLVIIITSFTPMLLDSYEWLYKAGEKNEKTYEAKSTMEKELAERDSNVLSRYSLDFGVKLENTAQVIFLNMRKAMENVQNGIQTVFYGGKGTIRVVSPSSIPDDEPTKEITILFNGINVTNTVVGNSSLAKREKNESTGKWEYQVAVQVIPPKLGAATGDDKTAFDPDHALSENDCTVSKPVMKDGKAYSDITVSGDIDVLTTVLKIVAYYKDENDEINSAEAYVRITPPTIMIVGETQGDISYYTSKGVDKKTVVVEEKDENGNTIYKNEIQTGFQAYGRPLREENLPVGGQTYKTAGIDTEFLSVNYIDNDNANNIEPYYVLTGTNGVIQRLFIARGNINEVSKVTGYGTQDIRSIEYKDGGLTKKLYHAFWGGDKAHQFGFSTFYAGDFKTSTGYYNEKDDPNDKNYVQSCWYTGDKLTASGKADKNIYGIQTRYSMYFNGFGSWCKEEIRNGRRISYILIEAGVPLRLTGTRVDDSDRFGGFLRSWEGSSAIDTLANDQESHWNNTKKVVRVINNDKDNEADNERAFAFLRLISYGNAPLDELLSDSKDSSLVQYLDNDESKDVNVTTAIYNQASGQMMYFGTVPAQGFLQQVDNISGNSNYAGWFQPETVWKVFWNDKKYIPFGGYTGYILNGSKDGGTTITKLCVESDRGLLLQALRKAQGVSSSSSYSFGTKEFYSDTTTESQNRATFFVERTYSGTADTSNTFYKLVDNDLEFTLGYSSNREQVFSNITYGTDKVEHHNYYERYFNLSHYNDINRSNGAVSGDYDDIPNSYYLTETSGHINQKTNSLYNVWFPGEFYNLTQTATKEGITVAVGYTVSGSTYQRFQPNTDNSSTALGGVFNDGVLAVLTSDNASFKNLLYYKDYENFQNSDITSNSHLKSTLNNIYNNYYKDGYGTHARKSVRFTAVDICVDGGKNIDEDGNNVTQAQRDKTYYAVYGDNQGRVYISKIASVSMPSGDIGNPNNPGEDGVGSNNPAGSGNLVTGIRDLATSNTNGTSSDPNAGYKDAEMNEMLDTKGNRLSEHFSEIVSIFVDEQTIYVTGRGNGTKDPMIAVCNINEGFKFTVITLVHNDASYNINDMMVLGGYLYCVGEKTNENKGFWIALDTEILNSCVKNGYDSIAKYATKHVEKYKDVAESAIQSINPVDDINLMPFQKLDTPLNSIAGRNT